MAIPYGQRIRKFFCEIDYFAANPTLRQDRQPYSATPCLGFLSLCLLGLFFYLLISNLIKIAQVDGDALTFTQSSFRNSGQRNINNFMFAFTCQIKNQPTQNYRNYFTFYAKIGNQTVPLQLCSKNGWQQLGDNYQHYATFSKFNESFCFTQKYNIQYNKSFDTFFSFYVDKCNSTLNPNCKSEKQMNDYFTQFFQSNAIFSFWMYFLTPFAELSSANPIKYVVEYKKLSITSNKSTINRIKFNQFNVQTDLSVWPIAQNIQTQRGFVPGQIFYAYSPLSDTNHYLSVQTFVGQNVVLYSRKIRKIDDLLSYLGGLLGLIVLFISFIVSKYNVYRYELKVAESTFNYNNDGIKIRESSLNIFTFLIYLFYLFFKTVTCQKFKWKKYDAMNQVLQESRQLLNVQRLFQRLSFLQDFVWAYADQNKLKVMSLEQPPTIDEVKLKRKIYQYFGVVTELKRNPTVQQLVSSQYFSEAYQKQLMKQQLKKKFFIKKQTKKLSQFNLQNQEQQSIAEIFDSLKKDLKLQDDQVCQKISKCKSIAVKARYFIIKQNLIPIQRQMAHRILNVPDKIRENMILKIPIIILHRLRLRLKSQNAQKIKKQTIGSLIINKKENIGGLQQKISL